jgi:hypothetical protein
MGMINREKDQLKIDEILEKASDLERLLGLNSNSNNKELIISLKEQLELERRSYFVCPDKLYLNKLEKTCVIIQKSLLKIELTEKEILNETLSNVRALNL